MALAFVTSPLDRADHLRRTADRLKSLKLDPRAKLLRLKGDQVECAGERPVTQFQDTAESVFLGLDHAAVPWFATQASETAELVGLRSLMASGTLDTETLSILAQARSLVDWHEKHGFCAACGARSEIMDGGYRRHCRSCGADHFPRTDPVVIIAVTWNKHVLMGRQLTWPPGLYSALAGFVEPGETIEQAARREVKEEAGVTVGQVHYHASQPWPFPSSLMIGLLGEAESHDLTIDSDELEDARWFSCDEVRAMLNHQHTEHFTAPKTYAIAHDLIRAAVDKA